MSIETSHVRGRCGWRNGGRREKEVLLVSRRSRENETVVQKKAVVDRVYAYKIHRPTAFYRKSAQYIGPP